MLKKLLVFLVLLLSACAPTVADIQWQTPGVEWVHPQPPEMPRIRFLRQISSGHDLRAENKADSVFKWIGGERAPELPLVSPYGVATDGEGRIWIADPGSSAVHMFDLRRNVVEYISALKGRQLVTPVGVVYDKQRKRLYVADAGLLEVLQFDNKNRYLSSLQSPQGFQRPAGLAIATDGHLYVADVLAGKIQAFSVDGRYIKEFGSQVTANGKFNRPANIAIDVDGRIYVVDTLNFRVEVLGLPGEKPAVIGGLGSVAGTFARPRGIAIDSQGHIYVSDAAFDNVQVFNRQGELLLIVGSEEKGPGQFCMPAGLVFDTDDRLYVADSCGYRVKIFQYLSY